MQVSFHLYNGAEHQFFHAAALKRGFIKHGIIPTEGVYNTPCNSDLAVVWTFKQHHLRETMLNTNRHILIMERGFIPDRTKWCSLSLDGFNGRGKYFPSQDNGQRFYKYFSPLLKPWRQREKGYALLIGQVPKDASLYGLDVPQWLEKTSNVLAQNGNTVLYRCHPHLINSIKRGSMRDFSPSIAIKSNNRTLEQDFFNAKFCVTYSSNTAVESVLSGVPTVAMHDGSVAYNMCSQDLNNPIFMPDRTKWCNDLAWKQFSIAEMESGFAWDHVKNLLK